MLDMLRNSQPCTMVGIMQGLTNQHICEETCIMAISAFISTSVIRQLSFLFIIIFLSGCAALNTHVYSPEHPLLYDIEDLGLDCKESAILGQQVLRGMGLKSRVVCGFWTEANGTPGGMGHCWNEVYQEEDQKWHLVDLNQWGPEGWPIDQYSEYIPVSIWYGHPDMMDLTFDRGADWQADNLDEIVRQLPEKRMPSPGGRVVPAMR